AVAPDLAELAGAVDLQDQVAAKKAELDELEDDFGIGAEIEINLIPNGNVLDGLLRQIGEPVAAVVAKDADDPVRERGRAEFRFLVVPQQVHPHKLLAIVLGTIAILDFEGDGLPFEGSHPLAPAVANGLGAFDGIDEVLAESLLDDFLGSR